jgi:hypothetical protein
MHGESALFSQIGILVYFGWNLLSSKKTTQLLGIGNSGTTQSPAFVVKSGTKRMRAGKTETVKP